MVKIYHRTCKAPAFLYDHMPAEGEPILAKYARRLDGRQMSSGDPRICGSCGRVWHSEELMPPPPLRKRTYNTFSEADMRELYPGGWPGIDEHA